MVFGKENLTQLRNLTSGRVFPPGPVIEAIGRGKGAPYVIAFIFKGHKSVPPLIMADRRQP